MARLHGVKTLDMVNGEITKVAHERTEYERVEGVVQTGDLVLIRTDVRDTTQGAYYYVRSTKGRYAVIRDDVGDSHDLSRGCYDLFREVSASQPSLEDRVSTNEKDIELLKSDVAALKGETEPEYVRIDKGEAKVGDFVKYIVTASQSVKIGRLYEIIGLRSGRHFAHIDEDGDRVRTVPNAVFEVYRKVSAAEPKPERLKVGDYARVVESGDILKIIETDQTSVPYRAEHLNGDYAGWLHSNSVVRATDEEVAEAKRKQAEEEERKRWAAIGRDVGEYKRGDVVQYLYDREICEVVDIAEDGRLEVATQNHGNCTENQSSIELVAPVESRFDRKGDE